MAEFRMPDVGEGLTEAQILTWQVTEGDTVVINQVLVEIETAKSVVELPSPFAGTITTLHVAEGETVTVGTPIVTIRETSQASTDAEETDPETASAGAEESGNGAILVGYGPRDDGQRRRRRSRGTTTTVSRPVRVPAKPPVRRFARELGVDLTEVPHEGANVTRADVEAWARRDQPRATTSEPPSEPEQEQQAVGKERREPVSHVRRATAEAVVASAFTAPHVTEWVSVDVSASVALVDTMRKDRAYAEVPVSILVLVARVVCLALRRHEDLHAIWADDEIIHPAHVGLGIAAATDRGLLVPVVPQAETLTTPDLAKQIHERVSIAREGRLQPEQMTGGTFTITNVGVFGVDGGTPILPPGQTGILAVGAVARRPWVDRDTDEVVARWVTTLSLSFDHRVVDGAAASMFLADVATMLEDPGLSAMF